MGPHVRWFKHLLAITLCTIAAFSLVRAQDWEFDYIPLSIIPGLAHAKSLTIHGAVQDEQGFIWLSTTNGLLRFDGVTFRPFAQGHADQIIPFMLEDNRMHVSPNGDIWIVDKHRGLLQVKRDGLEVLHFHNNLENGSDFTYGDLYFQNDSIAYITTSDWKVHRLLIHTQTWESLAIPSPENFVGNDLTFGHMVKDPNRKEILWIGSKYGLAAVNLRTYQIQYYGFETPYQYFINQQEWLVPLQIFDQKILLIGPYYAGIDVFDTKNRRWATRIPINEHYEPYFVAPKTSLAISDSLALVGLLSHEGMGFITLNSDGVMRFKAEFYETEYGTFQRTLRLISAPNNTLLAITERGLTHINNSSSDFEFYRLTEPDKLRSNWQRSFLQLDDPNTFLLGTFRGSGLIKVDWKNRTNHVIPYKAGEDLYNSDVTMWTMAQDHHASVWIGTDNGLIVADIQKDSIWQPQFIIDHPLLSHCDIHYLYFDKPDLWISTSDYGIFEADIDQEIIIHRDSNRIQVNCILQRNSRRWVGTDSGIKVWDQEARQWDTEATLRPDLAITDLLSLGDTIWLATRDQGLWCMKKDATDRWTYKQFINREAFMSNLLHKIIHVPETNTLWINTHYGYASFDLASHRFINYTMDDGIRFIKKNQSIFVRLADGAIINGAHRYFQYFYPTTLSKTLTVPIPYIDEILTGGNPVSFNIGKQLVLEAGTNSVSIALGGINYNHSPTNYYSFRFGAPGNVWSQWTTNEVVSFENLNGGEYQFAFRVANKLYEASDTLTLEIAIRKKPTETLGFQLGVIGALGLLLFTPFWYRNKQQKREAEIRSEYQQRINKLQMSALRVQMNPHFVFNSINSINYYIIKNDRDKASTYLAKFSRLIRLILDNSKLEFITLEQELEAISLYLEIEAMRFEGKFEYEILVDEKVQLTSIKIPPLIIQPYVENAIWHGFMPREGRGHLSVEIRERNGFVQCIIEDDGVGRDAASLLKAGKGLKKQSLGTKITSDRLKFIREKYDIQTNVETLDLTNMDGSPAGTRVTVTIPKLRPLHYE